MYSELLSSADNCLTINLNAVAKNWLYLNKLSSKKTKTAAMVKGNGYGFGSNDVAKALCEVGCDLFFVANLVEAIELNQFFLKSKFKNKKIFVLHGVHSGQEPEFERHKLIPVLNNLEQILRWLGFAKKINSKIPALIHFDTGMNRLGLDKTESRWLIENKHILEGLNVHFIMSHLSSGELPHDKENKKQLLKFQEIRTKFPKIPASLANSGGCLLGPEYHFQMTRIGIALYGIDPRGPKSSRLEPALKWHARILQVRSAEIGDRVGYNGTFELTRPSRIATIGVGYADGYHRKLGGRATIKIGKCVVPVIGRVSMDSVTADITDLDSADLQNNEALLIHSDYNLYDMAKDAETIPYEIITRLGTRAYRNFALI